MTRFDQRTQRWKRGRPDSCSLGLHLSLKDPFWFLSHLLAARVERLLQLLSGFWDVAFLHGGEVMRILQSDLQLLPVFLQRAQEVLGEAP